MNQSNINKLLGGRAPINIAIDKIARAIYFKVSEDDVVTRKWYRLPKGQVSLASG